MRKLIVIAHDIRSIHNIGSILRTADGFGVEEVIMTGYSPYPRTKNDLRLPHISAKITKQIHKTALGAENTVSWRYESGIQNVISRLKRRGYTIYALEQSSTSISLPSLIPAEKCVLLLGREVEGIDPALLGLCDFTVDIPMYGKKESFNVAQACAIALYALRES